MILLYITFLIIHILGPGDYKIKSKAIEGY